MQLELSTDYRGFGILIWNNFKGNRYFAIGNREFKTMAEAKAAIDRWHSRQGSH